MIVVGISSAQLDTIDGALLVELADAMAKIEDVERRFTSDGHPMRVVLFGALGALDRLFLIGEATQRTMLTLELRAPVFEDVPRVSDYATRPNPFAPIPDRIRRQLGRDPGKKPWHRR